MPQSPLAVAAEGLEKTVAGPEAGLTVIADIGFTVQAGETVALVGASGSGKTTLLSLLAGLDTPTKGRVHLAGRDITALSEDDRAAWRAGRVGFVFQSFQLLDGLTARENVLMPLELARIADADARADSWLDRVGLGARKRHYPRQLSGGEQQRVALARAFAGDPEILFADEPTGSLDRRTGDTVVDMLFGLNRERGTTLFLVTHDERLAARCGRILRLDAGRLVSDESGSTNPGAVSTLPVPSPAGVSA